MSLACEITKDLAGKGYRIGLTPADSLAQDVLSSGVDGSAYRISGLGHMAWTSGAKMSAPTWKQTLEMAYGAGYRAIIMNGHGAAGTLVPFRGVSRASAVQAAVDRINCWNESNPGRPFALGITFTIRQDHTFAHLEKMVRWADRNSVKALRFNAFANFTGKPEHRQYELSIAKIEQFYGWLPRLHQELGNSQTSLSVSEDFGDAGIQQIESLLPPEYRGQQIGRCRAGWRLFAIIQLNDELVVTGCVDRWLPVMGRVYRTGSAGWDIEWDLAVIARLRQARRFLYGCWGGVGWGREIGSGFNDPEAENFLLYG
ncbi:MAG: hypothetical protein PHU56_00930 [Candidatus Pacebacteria bacterium]|nr:hypothetical protein [Candidatus Paceibacterota bacterium]